MARLVVVFCVLAIAVAVQDTVDRSRDAWQALYGDEGCDPKMTLVISGGGVGTTTLQKHVTRIGVHVNHIGDKDFFKHNPIKLEKKLIQEAFGCSFADKIERVIYVFGDPGHAVFSLFRRNYHRAQAMKTRTSRLRRGEKVHLGRTAIDYADQEQDLFEFERHFDGYYDEACRNGAIPFLFIRSARVMDYHKELDHFLGSSMHDIRLEMETSISSGPPWYMRYADRHGEQAVTFAAEKLGKTYARLNYKFAKMGDFAIVQGNCTGL